MIARGSDSWGGHLGVGGQLLQIGGKGHHQLGDVIHLPIAVGRFVSVVIAVEVSEQPLSGKAA